MANRRISENLDLAKLNMIDEGVLWGRGTTNITAEGVLWGRGTTNITAERS